MAASGNESLISYPASFLNPDRIVIDREILPANFLMLVDYTGTNQDDIGDSDND